MGLFTGLLTLPLAPVRGVVWVAEQVVEEADRQLYDENRIRAELVQLEIDADEGRLDDEERQHMEDELLERLAVAQARKRREDAEPWGLSVPEVGPEPHLREENPDG